jgi:hypothetical protein
MAAETNVAIDSLRTPLSRIATLLTYFRIRTEQAETEGEFPMLCFCFRFGIVDDDVIAVAVF